MVNAIREKINPREIKDDSELKKIEGSLQDLSLYQTKEGEIIVRDGQEILIPKDYREEILKELHSSHLSDASMLNLAKSKLYWPGLKEDLKRIYKTCDQCLTNSISKPKASHEVIPTSMQVLQPNEVVHLDYCEVEGKDILIVKCKSTGHNWARITPNKTGETTVKTFERYINTFDRPRICVTDHGPAFSSTFVDYLQANHIIHHYSSYYRPQSNAPAERGVRSIKDVMSKIPGFSERSLHAAVFAINQHQAADGSGSPSERFFKRHVRSNLPRIMSKELKHDDIMRIRAEKLL